MYHYHHTIKVVYDCWLGFIFWITIRYVITSWIDDLFVEIEWSISRVFNPCNADSDQVRVGVHLRVFVLKLHFGLCCVCFSTGRLREMFVCFVMMQCCCLHRVFCVSLFLVLGWSMTIPFCVHAFCFCFCLFVSVLKNAEISDCIFVTGFWSFTLCVYRLEFALYSLQMIGIMYSFNFNHQNRFISRDYRMSVTSSSVI